MPDDVIEPLPIVHCGHPVLRTPALAVTPPVIDRPEFQALIDQMHVTMDRAPGVGLAAPQIGLGIQLAVLSDGPEKWDGSPDAVLIERERAAVDFTVLINPTVEPIAGDGLVAFFEGCLSVPGLAGVVTRARTVRVRHLDRHGEEVDAVYRGWPARIVQHEVDHLNGRLYLDTVATRSLSTTANMAYWSGQPITEVADALGFTLPKRA